jgi:hypothetical protein
MLTTPLQRRDAELKQIRILREAASAEMRKAGFCDCKKSAPCKKDAHYYRFAALTLGPLMQELADVKEQLDRMQVSVQTCNWLLSVTNQYCTLPIRKYQ